jgi:hypothetical protein
MTHCQKTCSKILRPPTRPSRHEATRALRSAVRRPVADPRDAAPNFHAKLTRLGLGAYGCNAHLSRWVDRRLPVEADCGRPVLPAECRWVRIAAVRRASVRESAMPLEPDTHRGVRTSTWRASAWRHECVCGGRARRSMPQSGRQTRHWRGNPVSIRAGRAAARCGVEIACLFSVALDRFTIEVLAKRSVAHDWSSLAFSSSKSSSLISPASTYRSYFF